MWTEFTGIIAAFELAHPEAQALKVALGKCNDSTGAIDLLDRTSPDQKGHCDSQEYRAFHLLCTSCLCEENNSVEWVAEEVAEAIKSFRKCGNRFHEGLARRVLATIYRKQGLESLAITELVAAEGIFQTCADAHNIENEYEQTTACKAQIFACGQQVREIEVGLEDSSEPPAAAPKNPAKKHWRSAQIVYGVFDMVHAGIKGAYVMDDSEIGEMAIEEILFDGKKHRIYNLRDGKQIKVVPSGRYAWLRVAGNSMNAAKPVPIEPNDYVLVNFNLQPQNGNLVFASLNDAPTPKERAGVIKRMASDGLHSESKEQYEPIPLARVKPQAVVLAVAKPEEENEATGTK